jgi:hypothetical protein
LLIAHCSLLIAQTDAQLAKYNMKVGQLNLFKSRVLLLPNTTNWPEKYLNGGVVSTASSSVSASTLASADGCATVSASASANSVSGGMQNLITLGMRNW